MSTIYDRLANSKDKQTWADRLKQDGKEGKHLLALHKFQYKSTKGNGHIFSIEGYVCKSETHTEGSIVTEAYFPNTGEEYQQDQALTNTTLFLQALAGTDKDDKRGASDYVKVLDVDAQPGRGVLIWAEVVRKHKVAQAETDKKKAQDAKSWLEVVWSHFEGQTPEQVKTLREKIEAEHPEKEGARVESFDTVAGLYNLF